MGFSARHFDIVSDLEHLSVADVQSVLGKHSGWKWAYCVHDKDVYSAAEEASNPEHKAGSLKKAHIHVYVNMNGNVWQSQYVAQAFGVAENFVGKVKGRQGDVLAYMTHVNAPDKYQYEPSEVVSNFDVQKTIEKSLVGRDNRKAEIIEKIGSGEWREWDIVNHVTVDEYVAYERQIDRALKYNVLLNEQKGHRDMNCFYFVGDSGTGKTTYAKKWAEDRNLSYYVSSSSNDPLDNYRGQDVIILDDLRGSSMKLTDLLKMLDPNTASSVKSRYRNKVLDCKAIIITTTVEIDAFFSQVFESDNETAVQLKRRCQCLLRFTFDEIETWGWSKNLRRYVCAGTIPNPIKDMFSSEDEALMSVRDMVEGFFGQLNEPEIDQLSDNVYVPFDDDSEQLPIFGNDMEV